jgi:hypothetical protein
LNTRPRTSAGGFWARGNVFVTIAVALSAFAFPEAASAHGGNAVIALDYVARPAANGVIAPGVKAKVIDGNRSVELNVSPGRTVVVRGYGGELFLRFSSRGVEANLRSPTVLATKLLPEGDIVEVGVTSAPRWTLVTSNHRLTWHDHRLGPRPGDRSAAGRVGAWVIPVAVDGRQEAIQGTLWRSTRPTLWPWLAIWLLTLLTAGIALRMATNRARRASVYAATVVSASLLLVVSVGFTAGSARAGFARSADVVLPLGIALAAVGVFFLRPRQRYVACALVAGFVLAAALEDVSVFWHGFVVSALPALPVRAGVALALAASGYAILVVAADLLRGHPGHPARRAPRARPRLAVPKGKPR